jgi:hypothetical protein
MDAGLAKTAAQNDGEFDTVEHDRLDHGRVPK